ncbi:PTS cellobiose transporter subunit IIA [Lactobacillus crispatus]|uniref:PTS cellobiose transporter subunit IIA n=1 Tax=Lactobacillus crispatus TaxID=47770 RepID=UPI00105FC664|nr:PTS cellobiose transporter subunit IIA [Lactobacillus crispatus]TDN19231.1 PTS cellobiose transporter subunit IIA [Lactobacillus crispatus]TDN20178.1 PTS cellobiose transporter subunit IIA [Lactobacillus crispatus]TDN33340.1 PTS cellobiose transporter subunit IIA [Lactobacillus crispatus]
MWLIIDVNYHSVLGIIVSAIMTIYSGIASIEQLTKMHNRKREVPISRVYLEVQAALNLLFIILTFLPLGKYLFPFIENQIMNDQDRYHKVIETFKKHQQ